MLKSGVITCLRHLIAKIGVNECNGDITPSCQQPFNTSYKQSFNNFATTAPHPNSTPATQTFHTIESGFRWRVAALEKSDVDEIVRYL
jgi:hypothetical protein